jgi:hypothetical protein
VSSKRHRKHALMRIDEEGMVRGGGFDESIHRSFLTYRSNS